MQEDTLFEIVTLSEVLSRERAEREKLQNENQTLIMQNIYLRDKLSGLEKSIQTLTDFNIKLRGFNGS